MKFSQPLEPVTVIKRYKRFLADVIHPEKGEITIHCPNTGSMKNCWQQGWKAWVLNSNNPKRKYLYTWVLSENDQGDLIGVNTHFANEIVAEGILSGKVKELKNYDALQKEVKYGEENSRIDILLTQNSDKKTYIEVKSVTLLENDQGFFPDAVTTRGQKHLRELMVCVESGHRAILFFLVQHTGIKNFSPAKHIDPKYTQLLHEAIEKGVEVLVYNTKISNTETSLFKPVKFIFPKMI